MEKYWEERGDKCPKCGEFTEILTDGKYDYKERCPRGCFVFNFEED